MVSSEGSKTSDMKAIKSQVFGSRIGEPMRSVDTLSGKYNPTTQLWEHNGQPVGAPTYQWVTTPGPTEAYCSPYGTAGGDSGDTQFPADNIPDNDVVTD